MGMHGARPMSSRSCHPRGPCTRAFQSFSLLPRALTLKMRLFVTGIVTAAGAPAQPLAAGAGAPVANAAGADVWILRMLGNASFSWTVWSPDPTLAFPLPLPWTRHVYGTRPLVTVGSTQLRIEHSVFLFGGAAMRCNVANPTWLQARSLSPKSGAALQARRGGALVRAR